MQKPLKQLRLEKKQQNKQFTQSYMARELGVTLKSYIMYEDGTMGISEEKYIKLKDILGSDFER